jgi:hypothetical protein
MPEITIKAIRLRLLLHAELSIHAGILFGALDPVPAIGLGAIERIIGHFDKAIHCGSVC